MTHNGNGHVDLKKSPRSRQVTSHDRLPPYSPEDEQATLGAILLDAQKALPEAMAILTDGPDSFYDLRHNTIYGAFLNLRSNNSPIDLVSLYGWLKDRMLLDQVGGVQFVSSLADAAPIGLAVGYYAERVQQKYLLRKLIRACTEIATQAYDSQDQDAMGMLDEAERLILSIRPKTSADDIGIKQIAQEAIADIEEQSRMKGSISGISTGLIDLDVTTDGLHNGDMIVLAAFPSVGKTSLAANIAEHVAVKECKPVGIFTMEMTSRQIVIRLICSLARVNLRYVKGGAVTDVEVGRLVKAGGRIGGSCIYLDDTPGQSIYQLRARARRMSQQHGLSLIVVDYLQLMNATGGPIKLQNREQEVSEIARGIKEMAKELNVPVIVLSQLNDDGKLRESRAIGMHADDCWELQRDKEPDEPGGTELVTLWVKKQRNGPRNVPVRLVFQPGITRFGDRAKVEDGQEDLYAR